ERAPDGVKVLDLRPDLCKRAVEAAGCRVVATTWAEVSDANDGEPGRTFLALNLLHHHLGSSSWNDDGRRPCPFDLHRHLDEAAAWLARVESAGPSPQGAVNPSL